MIQTLGNQAGERWAQSEKTALTVSPEKTVSRVKTVWAIGRAYVAGDRVQHDGTLYKCVQAHTSQTDWTPDATPALWVVVSIDEYPEWVQPTGAHDAYNTGDKVTHNGKTWVSDVDNNVWEPGVYGWKDIMVIV